MPIPPVDVSEWFDMMSETVSINAYVSTAGNGIITYSAVTQNFVARVEMKNHLIVDRHGNNMMARGRVFLGTTTMPDIKDKITLPARFTPRIPPIIDVYPVEDELGVHHITIEIG